MRRRLRQIKILSRHPFAVPVFTIAFLLLVSGGIYWFAEQTNRLPKNYNVNIVIISHDNKQQIVPSKEKTVGKLLGKLNIKLGEGDVVEPSVNTRIDQDQFRVNIYRALPVQIVDGTDRTFAFSAAKTPRSIAEQAGTQLYPEDIVKTVPAEDFLRTSAIGEQVIVNRAIAVNVDLYGTPVVLRTHAKTVGELIKEKNIKLVANDQIVPSTDTPISAGQPIAFIRTGSKTETVTEQIATPVQVINDPTLAFGTSAVRQQGTPGEQVVTYQIDLVNNVETSRKVIQKVVTKNPVNQVEVRGSATPSPGDVRGAIAYWAQHYGVNADYLLSVAKCESNFRTNAVGGGGLYLGLFQYAPSTWSGFSANAGVGGASIWDGNAQARTTAWAFANGKSSHWGCA